MVLKMLHQNEYQPIMQSVCHASQESVPPHPEKLWLEEGTPFG